MADTDSNEVRIAQLEALDGVLGYMSRALKDADYKEPYIQGYVHAKSDIAHIRATVWFDWHRVDPKAAAEHRQNWESIHAQPYFGKHRISPKPEVSND